MPTRLANLGYLGLGKETTKGTAAIPSIYVPLYDDSFKTSLNLDEDNPIVGNKYEIYQALMGARDHQGEITVLAEPNTAGHILNMLMTKGTTTGAGPYTHPFTFDPTTDPKSYTIDLLKGQMIERYIGAEASELGIDYDKNKMLLKVKISALKSFTVREIASVFTNVVTFKTNYDASPTDGLVATDTVRIMKASDGTTQDFTVTSITATTATLSGSPTGIVAGDLFFLRAQTPSYTLRNPFLWAKSEFRFGATAAAALSATQTRMEDGSKWSIMHKFANDEGEKRSGAFDPAALARTQGRAELETKIFFDTVNEFNRYMTAAKGSYVVRHYSEDTTYEMRVTLNNLKITESPIALKSGEILFQEQKQIATYDTADAQAVSVTILNNLSTI